MACKSEQGRPASSDTANCARRTVIRPPLLRREADRGRPQENSIPRWGVPPSSVLSQGWRQSWAKPVTGPTSPVRVRFKLDTAPAEAQGTWRALQISRCRGLRANQVLKIAQHIDPLARTVGPAASPREGNITNEVGTAPQKIKTGRRLAISRLARMSAVSRPACRRLVAISRAAFWEMAPFFLVIAFVSYKPAREGEQLPIGAGDARL